MVRPSLRDRELHLNKRICRPSSVKFSRTRSSAASAASRSPAILAPAKSASIFHNFSGNRDSIDIGKARLIRYPRHSLPMGKRSLSPNGLSPRLRLARDYEKRIDVVHAMILVAMRGTHPTKYHPGFSKQTLRCAVASLVWFPTCRTSNATLVERSWHLNKTSWLGAAFATAITSPEDANRAK